jgi:O-antigen/teichoic acid export membrane protein
MKKPPTTHISIHSHLETDDLAKDSTKPHDINVDSQPTETSADVWYRKNLLLTAKGGGLSFIGRVFEYAMRFVFSIIVARTLLAENYGLYVIGLTVASIVPAMSMLGLQTGMVRYLAPAVGMRDEKRMWGIIQVCLGIPAVISLVLAAGVFLLAEPIAISIFKDARLIAIIQLVSLCIPLETISFLAYVIVISFKQPKYMVFVSDFLTPLVKLLLTIGFLLLGWGTVGAVMAYVAASAVGMIAILYFVNALFSLRRPLQSAERQTKEILIYSMPVYLAYVLSTVRGTVETLVLGFFGLTAGVGIYSIAQRLSALGSMVYLAIGNISTPVFADLNTRGDKAQLRAFYKTTSKWIFTFNLPLFLTFAIFAVPILSIFGAEFTEGALGLMILALGSLFYTGTGLGANVLDMTDHTRLNSINSAMMVIITIIMDLFLIPRFGILGAAIAAAFSTVIVNIVCMIEVFVIHKMLPFERGFLKLLAAGLVAAVVTLFITPHLTLPSLLLLAIGASILWGVYLLTLFALGISPEDRMVIASFRYRLKRLLPNRSPAG